jgi:hypothetical protein
MVFIPGNALGGGFSWICAPLAPPQWGLILVKPCPSGFMLHLVHFKPFIFRTQERVTCLHTSKKSSCLQFQEGWWKSAPEKSLATLRLCSLERRRKPGKQDIEKKIESDADQLATDWWWWWWYWFLQILGVLLLLVSLVMLDATGFFFFFLWLLFCWQVSSCRPRKLSNFGCCFIHRHVCTNHLLDLLTDKTQSKSLRYHAAWFEQESSHRKSCKSISTRAEYVTLPWKPWMMRYRQSNLVNSLEDCCDREKLHNVESPGGALKQSNEHRQSSCIYWLLPVSD